MIEQNKYSYLKGVHTHVILPSQNSIISVYIVYINTYLMDIITKLILQGQLASWIFGIFVDLHMNI